MHHASSNLEQESSIQFDKQTLAAIKGSPSIAVFTIDDDGIITDWNLGAEKLYGFDKEDLIDQHCQTLFPENAINTLNKNLAKIIRGRVIPEVETQGRRKDGHIIDILFSMHPIKHSESGHVVGAITMSTDISAKKLTENALVERANQIKAIVETVPDAIITIDSTGVIEAVNPAIQTIFGYAPHEVIGSNVTLLMPSPYREEHDGYLKRYLSTRKAKVIGIGREVTGLRKNGDQFPMELAVNLVIIDGREAFVGVVKDISERKLNELALEEQYSKTEEANTALTKTLAILQSTQAELVEAEKMAALGSMVAGVAHEINTPLGISLTAASHLEAAIMSISKGLAAKTLTQSTLQELLKSGNEASQLILRNLDKAATLISSFKKLSIDQSDEGITEGNLSATLHSIIASVRTEIESRNCQIELNCPEHIRININTNTLQQVLKNLLCNAAIHAYPDEAGGPITITVEEQSDTLTIMVADQGRGMDKGTLAKAFEPFFTTRRNKGGMGLGLHLVYNLVKQSLHGKIEAHSTEGAGSTFTITVPK